jgi:hypothetical protein
MWDRDRSPDSSLERYGADMCGLDLGGDCEPVYVRRGTKTALIDRMCSCCHCLPKRNWKKLSAADVRRYEEDMTATGPRNSVPACSSRAGPAPSGTASDMSRPAEQPAPTRLSIDLDPAPAVAGPAIAEKLAAQKSRGRGSRPTPATKPDIVPRNGGRSRSPSPRVSIMGLPTGRTLQSMVPGVAPVLRCMMRAPWPRLAMLVQPAAEGPHGPAGAAITVFLNCSCAFCFQHQRTIAQALDREAAARDL